MKAVFKGIEPLAPEQIMPTVGLNSMFIISTHYLFVENSIYF